MSKPSSYTVGRWLGRYWTELVLSVMSVIVIVLSVVYWQNTRGVYVPAAAPMMAAKPAPVDPVREICTNGLADLVVTARKSLAAKDYEHAYATLDQCKHIMGDPEAVRIYQAAMGPAEASIKRRTAKEKKSKGVAIGMSAADIVASSWGKPQKINSTTRASGTHEQWVYGGGNYLYLEDGVLTSIHN